MEKRNDDSIYRYLKRHPGVIISIVPGVTFLFAFVFNLILYLKTFKYLNYWGITETSIIEINFTQKTFMIAICILLILILFLQKMVSDMFSRYLLKMEGVYALKFYEKANRKKVKQERRYLNKNKRKLKRTQVKGEFEEVKNEITESETLVLSIQDDLDMMRHCRKIIQKYFLKKMIIPLAAMGGLTFIFAYCTIFIMIGDIVWWKMVLYATAFALWVVALLQIYDYLIFRGLLLKRLAKYNSLNSLSNGIRERYFTEEYLEQLPKLSFKYSIKEFFNNKSLKSFAIQILFMSVIFFITFSLTITNVAKSNGEYRIVTHGKQPYVIIYENSNNYYLEEANIYKNKITIDTTSVRVLSKDDVCYETMFFENVEKLD